MQVYPRKYRTKGGETRTGRFWVVEVTPAESWDGRRHRASLRVTGGERVAWAAAERWLEERRAGTRADRHSEVGPIVDAYLAELERRSTGWRHRAYARQRLGVLLEGVRTLGELTTARVEELLARASKDRGLGPRTQNFYRGTLHGLFAWLMESGRWTGPNPVAAVEPARVREDMHRRALLDDELDRLVEHAPLHRAACYLLAAHSGFRRAEIATLLESQLDLDQELVRLSGQMAKNSLNATQPLTARCVELLRRYLRDVQPGKVVVRGPAGARGERLFAAVPTNTTLAGDARRAGIDPTGVDFHALRVTYGTLLARRRVPLQLARLLMRHSDVRLTAQIYSRLVPDDARAAVALLDRPAGTAPRTAPYIADELA